MISLGNVNFAKEAKVLTKNALYKAIVERDASIKPNGRQWNALLLNRSRQNKRNIWKYVVFSVYRE